MSAVLLVLLICDVTTCDECNGMASKCRFALVFIIMVVIVIIIGLYASGPVWRGFAGDVIIVILLFYFVKVFSSKPSWMVALSVLALSFFIELVQFFQVLDVFGIESELLRGMIGSVFDWLDLLAYLIGFIVCLCMSCTFNRLSK